MTINPTEEYLAIVEEMKKVFADKNNDYGNAFLKFRDTTFIDLIRAKLDRVEHIMEMHAKGESPRVAEGIESEMRDISNYSILMLVARIYRKKMQ